VPEPKTVTVNFGATVSDDIPESMTRCRGDFTLKA